MRVARASRVPATAPSPGIGVEVEPVTEWSAFLALRDGWNELWERSPERDNPFLSHEWLRAWWDAFGSGRQLLVLRLTDGGRLVALAPLMVMSSRYHGAPIRVVSLIANDHTNRSEFILSERPAECVRAVLEHLKRSDERWDMLDFDFLPRTSATLREIERSASDLELRFGTKPSYRSPYIPLADDWSTYWGAREGRFRRNLKNRETRLAKLGKVELEEWPESVGPTLLDELFEVGERSWKGGAQAGTALGSTPELRRFYGRLAELTHPKGWLSLHVLRLDGKAIAFHYSLMLRGTVGLLKTEYDLEYRPYSPGHQIQKRVLRSLYDKGFREFDFLGPDMEWKREWADASREHVRGLVFRPATRSRAMAFCELRAKPALKRSKLLRRIARAAGVMEAQD